MSQETSHLSGKLNNFIIENKIDEVKIKSVLRKMDFERDQFEKNIDSYMVNAEFKKTGNTELILDTPSGEKIIYDLKIERYSYDIKKKN